MVFCIHGTGPVSQEIKKSRFVAQVFRVASEDEAREKIAEIVAANPKANHTCWAFILGDSQEIQRYSDDGEPSGTAGVPILEVLKKQALTDVLVTVTRYFGGVKLGTGGLIRAYASSASLAIAACERFQKIEMQTFRLILDYGLFDSLQRFLAVKNLSLQETQFAEQVNGQLAVPLASADNFLQALVDEFNGKIEVKKGGKSWMEVAV
ncbi:MAG: YigZ family protein [Streptococcaceae bacterium]|jgi:uncharacterized YigZ family protein|nr:YigZ family protein [Streptococcaceae bacterium]